MIGSVTRLKHKAIKHRNLIRLSILVLYVLAALLYVIFGLRLSEQVESSAESGKANCSYYQGICINQSAHRDQLITGTPWWP